MALPATDSFGAATQDFHIGVVSDAINAGTNLLTDVPDDFDSQPRDSVPDVGAYEYI